MPKRTTPFQMIIHFVRKHTARPGVTVTESKELLGIEREVHGHQLSVLGPTAVKRQESHRRPA